MKITRYFAYLTSAFFLTSCGDDDTGGDSEAIVEVVIKETITLERVQKISKNGFLLNEHDSIAIIAGPTGAKFININVYQENIQEGYSVITTSNDDPSISVEAKWDEDSFVQSNTTNTNVNFEITSVDFDNLLAKIKFSASLVNPETNEVLVINESILEMGGISFNLLTKGLPLETEEITEEPELVESPKI